MRAEVKELSRLVGQAKKAGDETRAADLSSVASESDQRLLAHPQLPEGSVGFAQIIDPQGQVLAATGERGDASLLSPSELVHAEHGRLDVDQGQRVQLLASRVSRSSPNVLVVGVSTADRDSALASLQRLLFIGGPIALLIACAAGYIVAAKALDPVETMRKRAARMCGFGSDERLPVPPARDEIQRLGETHTRPFKARVIAATHRDLGASAWARPSTRCSRGSRRWSIAGERSSRAPATSCARP